METGGGGIGGTLRKSGTKDLRPGRPRSVTYNLQMRRGGSINLRPGSTALHEPSLIVGALPARRRRPVEVTLSLHVGKYLQVFRIGIQNTLVYRLNFFFRAGVGLIPLMGTIFLWQAVYADKGGNVGGYALSQMISYYLLVTVIDAFTAVAEDDWQIAGDIKDGQISQFLVRPINYLAYRFWLYLSGRLIYTTVALVPVGVFVFVLREHVVLPPSLGAGLVFVASLAMAALLQFMIACTMALLAFWVLDVSTFIFIQFAFEHIASGHLFPVDILPVWMSRLMMMTPYPYMLYFPAGVYLGRIRGGELWGGLCIQAVWVVLVFLLLQAVWRRGVRRYSAVGG